VENQPPETELTSDVAAPGYLAEVVGAAEAAAGGLADGSPAGWRTDAYKIILAGVLQDSIDNGTAPPDDQDAENLRGFVRDASQVALAGPAGLQDETFSVVLQALTDDWVVNWNAPFDEEEDEEEEDEAGDVDDEEPDREE
jgi:hypothetical protein